MPLINEGRFGDLLKKQLSHAFDRYQLVMRCDTSNPGSFEGPHLLALSEAEAHRLLQEPVTRRLSLDCSGKR